MLKDAVSALGLELCAEIALVLFFLAFVLVVVDAFRRSPAEVERCANIPLSDGEEIAELLAFAPGDAAGSARRADRRRAAPVGDRAKPISLLDRTDGEPSGPAAGRV